MLYQILILYNLEKEADRLKDYLKLSGCEVQDGELVNAMKRKRLFFKVDAVIFYCQKVEQYFETCKNIRSITQIPILILSPEGEEWDKIKMFEAGADDYLVEPLPQGELLARLRTHIERYKRLTRPFGYIEVGGLFIDAFSRQVILNGEEVPMRAKEFDILLYLAQRPNRIVSKQELYTAIWKDDLGAGYYNSVAVHIKRIRMKIEENPMSPQFVETVWGIGYRFRTNSGNGM